MANQNQKINIQSLAYQTQKLRRYLIDTINEERYILLSTLFGSMLEDGRKNIKDYSHFTMYDAASEIKLRTAMMRSVNNSRVRHHYDEEKRKEKELLEKLKSLQ